MILLITKELLIRFIDIEYKQRNRMKKVVSVLALSICALPLLAQYPIIPDSVKQRAARQEAEINRKSDMAWQKAFPVVQKEEKSGRPYKPWASKPEDLLKATIPVFPGAEGGGAFTPGGRGGKVVVVTSLADAGPGTLREACEIGGARVVVFNVAGIIRLSTPIHLRAPYITIAGQTAPGDGICVTGSSFLIDTHDVVLRHIRFRRGAQEPVTLVMRLMHQRLEQAGLVLEMIIERGLGEFGGVHDVLHRRRGVARMGEVFERRPQKLPSSSRIVHRLGHKNLPNGR